MKFTGSIAQLKLNRKELSETFKKNCETLLRNAAREWVRAVVVKIPVWTGMARGAIKFAKGRSGPSAGQFLSTYLRVAVPIGPTRTVDGKPLEVRDDKSPELGGRQSRYTFSNYDGKFIFTYNTDVEHLIYNDFHAGGGDPSPSAPWRGFEAARQAFFDHIELNGHKTIPNIQDFVTVSNIKV